jgi:hypothetical protein
MATLSVNQMAWRIAQRLLDNPDFYGVNVSKSTAGATIVDAGVNAPGAFQAGKKLTELCMGGAGKAKLSFKTYGDLNFPLNNRQHRPPRDCSFRFAVCWLAHWCLGGHRILIRSEMLILSKVAL